MTINVDLWHGGKPIADHYVTQQITYAQLSGGIARFDKVGESTKSGELKLIRVDAVFISDPATSFSKEIKVHPPHPESIFSVEAGKGVTVRFTYQNEFSARLSERDGASVEEISKLLQELSESLEIDQIASP